MFSIQGSQLAHISILIQLRLSNLPSTINWEAEGSKNELSYILHLRCVRLKIAVYLPVLHFVIHQPPGDPCWASGLPLAWKCIDFCETLIRHSDLENDWRHGGSWFKLRSVFSSSLLILAAVRCGKIELSTDWMGLVQKALRILEVRSDDATDVRWMSVILHRLVKDMIGKSGHLASSLV